MVKEIIHRFSRMINFVLLLSMFVGVILPFKQITSYDIRERKENRSIPQKQAQSLLEKLTPQEKVGQLVMVTFAGYDTNLESQINQLISKGHVGGVLITSANNNIEETETIQTTWSLIRSLQEIEYMSSLTEYFDNQEKKYQFNYVPLFIGINQEGDGAPYDQILKGLTPLPNQMAIGATWDPPLAEKVGMVLGDELSALGINMLFSPSLDILENPNPEGLGDMGTRTFGGDPFWVGEFAKSFISGVHKGSVNRVALVGKYFAGRGGSDRLPDEEVATIRKSLDQLNQIELSPFFAVTGNAPTPESTVDALLTSHIRYQGFQGNIRTTTKPISFDPQALSQLMNLAPLASWRKNNGVMVSDDLGNLAVRRFFDPTEQTYNARTVARDALLAGNDLLLLGNVTATGDPDSFTTVMKTLDFFEQKYREDDAFAKRVDEAVLRLLSLKFKLYPTFNIQEVVSSSDGLEKIGKGTQIAFEVAQRAATLIDPSASELDSLLPLSPQIGEKIVFLTDTYLYKQCENCLEQPVLTKEAVQQAVVRLYGQTAGGQIRSQDLISFSSADVKAMLEKQRGITNLEYYLRQAHWVVISLLDVKTSRPDSISLRQFIAERSYLLRNKNVIIFSFGAPYFLDSTNISKITAYYGLYSKGPQFVDVAARLLFNEIRPIPGALPVSVQGIGYDLISIIAPDSQQIIPLAIESSTGAEEDLTATPASETGVKLNVGDLISLRAGEVKDYNGNIVPDNTPVHFVIMSKGELSSLVDEVISPTVGGIAKATFSLKSLGTFEISARSEMAVKSQIIHIEIPGEVGIASPQPTIQVQLTNTIEPVIITPTPIQSEKEDKGSIYGLLSWFLAIIISAGFSWSIYRYGVYQGKIRWSMKAGLLTMIIGLCAYSYAVLKLPGSRQVWVVMGQWTSIFFTILGNVIGIILVFLWDPLFSKQRNN